MDLHAFQSPSQDLPDHLAGEITAVDEATSTCTVAADSFDSDQSFGPCPVMPHGTDMPAGGEPCLIVRDQAGGWWVACWTPAA